MVAVRGLGTPRVDVVVLTDVPLPMPVETMRAPLLFP